MHQTGVTATANAPRHVKGFYLRKSMPTFAPSDRKTVNSINKLKQGKSMDKNGKSVRAKPMADGAETISGGSGDGLRRRRRLSPPGSVGAFCYVRNPFGIRIKQCCASCQWKQVTDSLVWRKCKRWKKKVKPRQCCRCWSLRAELLKLRIRN